MGVCGFFFSSSFFLPDFIKGRIDGNVLINDALNTFYLPLYGVGHMRKGNSDSERGNSLPPLKELPFYD